MVCFALLQRFLGGCGGADLQKGNAPPFQNRCGDADPRFQSSLGTKRGDGSPVWTYLYQLYLIFVHICVVLYYLLPILICYAFWNWGRGLWIPNLKKRLGDAKNPLQDSQFKKTKKTWLLFWKEYFTKIYHLQSQCYFQRFM